MKQTKKHITPGYTDLFLPTLKALLNLGGSATNEEIHNEVIKLESFPNEIVDELHPGSTIQTQLQYNLAWARTYLKKNELVVRSKNGVWAITPQGAKLGKQDTIDKKAITKGRYKKLGSNEPQTVIKNEESHPWKEALSKVLHEMSPYAFEVLAKRLLRECGFQDVIVTPKSNDGGIDGTGKLRLNGIFSFNVAFQCKRYEGTVQAPDIRNFRGSLDNNIEKGVLITTGSFSQGARAEAVAPGKKQIDLMDGSSLMDKLAEYEMGLTPRIEYDIDEKFFAEIDAECQGSVDKDIATP